MIRKDETKQYIICDYCGEEDTVDYGVEFYHDYHKDILMCLPEHWTFTMFLTQNGKYEKKMLHIWCSYEHREKWVNENDEDKEKLMAWILRG